MRVLSWGAAPLALFAKHKLTCQLCAIEFVQLAGLIPQNYVQLKTFELSTPQVTAVPSALIIVTLVWPEAAVRFMTFVFALPKTVNKWAGAVVPMPTLPVKLPLNIDYAFFLAAGH